MAVIIEPPKFYAFVGDDVFDFVSVYISKGQVRASFNAHPVESWSREIPAVFGTFWRGHTDNSPIFFAQSQRDVEKMITTWTRRNCK